MHFTGILIKHLRRWLQVSSFIHNIQMIFLLAQCKGQIISKGRFGILEFSKKKNKRIHHILKTNSFIRFLGEFEETKSPFEIIGPLLHKF